VCLNCESGTKPRCIKKCHFKTPKVERQASEKTYAQDFLEKFPNARIGDDGLPEVCRMEVYGTRCLSMTGDMCTMCWCEPMEK